MPVALPGRAPTRPGNHLDPRSKGPVRRIVTANGCAMSSRRLSYAPPLGPPDGARRRRAPTPTVRHAGRGTQTGAGAGGPRDMNRKRSKVPLRVGTGRSRGTRCDDKRTCGCRKAGRGEGVRSVSPQPLRARACKHMAWTGPTKRKFLSFLPVLVSPCASWDRTWDR